MAQHVRKGLSLDGHAELAGPGEIGLHGLAGPIIMDATVPQQDGYRFIYTLPFGPRHLLIEDTYFSDGRDLAPDLLRQHIADYAVAQGWQITAVTREEAGILPLAIGGDIEKFLDEGVPGVARVGLGAGLFNPVTGYSFPDAVRMADLIVVLDGSHVVEVGSHEELIAKGGQYSELYGIQAAAYR